MISKNRQTFPSVTNEYRVKPLAPLLWSFVIPFSYIIAEYRHDAIQGDNLHENIFKDGNFMKLFRGFLTENLSLAYVCIYRLKVTFFWLLIYCYTTGEINVLSSNR